MHIMKMFYIQNHSENLFYNMHTMEMFCIQTPQKIYVIRYTFQFPHPSFKILY